MNVPSGIRGRLTQSRRRPGGLSPKRSLTQSFNYAFEGIIHSVATQRNMRIHVVATVVALAACELYGVGRVEFALVVLAAAFVMAAEMINTAVEAAIDVSTSHYNPLAKIAKDVAAGAVLIATVAAIFVGYLVFGWRVAGSAGLLVAVRNAPVMLTIGVLIVTVLAVIALKAWSRSRGTRSGVGYPSGHAAVAFAGWSAITFATADYGNGMLVSIVALAMALLVSHTRVESGVHTWFQVVSGGLIGALVALVVFQLALL